MSFPPNIGSRVGRGITSLKKLVGSIPSWVAEGDIIQGGAAGWQVLAPGTAGQHLMSGGAGALNTWTTIESGPTSWNPTDLSGASLTFTVITAQYYQIGKMVFVFLEYTMPVTGSGNATACSLPVSPSATPSITQFGFAFLSPTTHTIAYQVVPSGPNIQFLTLAGVSVSNAVASTQTFLCSFIYLAA